MSKYLAIGKVSKLKNVGIKSLRYYDEIGVFRPAYINHDTNYRYYSEEQLPMLDAISTCIELGIPLKNLSSYVVDGNFDIQRLLGDCKLLAESRIHAIYDSLSRLQNTFEKDNYISYSATPMKEIPSRTVLTSELSDDDNISQKILRLLMLAQLLGIDAGYPSGIIYQYNATAYKRLLYITITDAKGSEDSRILQIPSGQYYYHESSTRLENNPKDIYSLTSVKNNMIIETDILDEDVKAKGYEYEIQYML